MKGFFMKRISLMLILLIASALVITGSALADDQMISNEGMTVIHVSDSATHAMGSVAHEKNAFHSYHSSENGPEIMASPKAQLAAKLYQYDKEKLGDAVSDAGGNYFASEHQPAEVTKAIANFGKEGTICLTC